MLLSDCESRGELEIKTSNGEYIARGEVSGLGFYQFGRLALGLFGVTAVVAQTGVFVGREGREVRWRLVSTAGGCASNLFGEGLLLRQWLC